MPHYEWNVNEPVDESLDDNEVITKSHYVGDLHIVETKYEDEEDDEQTDEYQCDECDEGPFDSPGELGAHKRWEH